MPTGITAGTLRAFLANLNNVEDQRKPPDGRRRGQFRRGWTRATSGTAMSHRTLDARLTWHNLGYRAGIVFGPASDAAVDDAFEAFALTYTRDRA